MAGSFPTSQLLVRPFSQGHSMTTPVVGRFRPSAPLSIAAVAVCLAVAVGPEARAQLSWASDNAGNYSGGWTNGSDGGTGFGGWSFSVNQGSGFAGTFIGDPTYAGITGFGTQAFGQIGRAHV